jgi:hypothetical protein
LLVAATSVLFAGCTGIANLHIPTPPPGSPGGAPAATTTVVSNLSGVALPSVPPGPPPTVPLGPGTTTLTGIVTGPSGVVAGATVLVERLVDNAVGSKMVSSAADGTWKLPNILGGLYRIRAWQAPALDLVTPQIVLLGAGATMSVPLSLMAYSGESATASVAPSPPQVGVVSTLTINIVGETVGADGVVRAAPQPGATVTVLAAGNVVLAGTNPGTSDRSGQVSLALGCSSVGPVGLSVTIDNSTTIPVTVPDCYVPVAPVTTVPAATTTSTSFP